MGKAIKWAWRYGSLGAEVFDTLDDAIQAAFGASDSGDESLDCIEHEGELISRNHPLMEAEEERRDAEWDERQAKWKPVAQVEVQAPNGGQWARTWAYDSQEKAAAAAASLAEIVGDSRVRIVPIPAKP